MAATSEGAKTYTDHLAPMRQKRRQALSCDQCRRRKIRCDRNQPCRQCTKAGLKACLYVHDDRTALTTAPFEAEETQFLVFDRTLATQKQRPMAKIARATKDLPSGMGASGSRSQLPPNHHEHDNSSQSVVPLSPSIQSVQLDSALLGYPTPSEPKTPENPFPIFNPTITASVQGTFSGTRFYGQSHYMNFQHQTSEIMTVMQAHETYEQDHGSPTLANCKALGETLKTYDLMSAQKFAGLREMVPTRETCDHLVQAYLRTFQLVLGILYVPTFRQDYLAFWRDCGSASENFVASLLLIISIGSAFSSHDTGISQRPALQWICTVATWLSFSASKSATSLEDIRIQCLYFLACQANSFRYDKTRLSPGMLARHAMHIGLHIDPEKYTLNYMFPSELETRRRLWAVILELEIQSSIDSGGLPCIDIDDFDCASVSNVDDASLQSSSTVNPKPPEELTQSSFQMLLVKMIPVRLKIVRFINKIQSEGSFEKTMSLSAEFSSALKSCATLIEAYHMSSSPPTSFQTKLFDLLVHRFLLVLHHPFAVKAMSNPSYYYSRKICLETALSFLSSPTQVQGDDFHRLQVCSIGPFRNVYRQCALYLCRELTCPMDLDAPFATNSRGTRASQETRRAVQNYLDLAKARMGGCDRSFKCYVLVLCLLAQAEAGSVGAAVEPAIAGALKKGLETCHSLMRSRVQTMPELSETPIELETMMTEQFDWS